MASTRTSYTIAEDAALLIYVESHPSYRSGNAIYKIFAESTSMVIMEAQIRAYLAALLQTSKSDSSPAWNSESSPAWNTPSTSTGTRASASTSASISIFRSPVSKPRNRKELLLPPEAQESEFRKNILSRLPLEARAAKRRRLNRTAEIPSTPKEMLGTPSSCTPTGSKFRQQKQDEEEEEEDMSKNEQ
ncbi:hypothetical protein E4U14_000819, partial [Claviceps sp. LM454 group G7]